ncbi:hypothetical protein [Streptomyces sp. NBC_00996]|nr:hypothetical protein OG390_01785 [Streptomyces sp. NBC_00996]
MRGHARLVTELGEERRLTEGAHTTPRAGGRRHLWARIDPYAITGRRIAV